LHTKDGYVRELEVVKADGTKMVQRPQPGHLDVLVH
jgi:hypothetical protein